MSRTTNTPATATAPDTAAAVQPPATTMEAPGTSSVGEPQQARAAVVVRAGDASRRCQTDDVTLPGPRRELEGRGGAVAGLCELRLLIRCPQVAAVSRAITPRTGGRPGVPDLVWLFYLAAVRVFRSAEKLDQELATHWDTIREEFRLCHDVTLAPKQLKPRTTKDSRRVLVPHIPLSYEGFNAWRKRVVLPPEPAPGVDVLEDLLTRLTVTSHELALAIRHAETGLAPDQYQPNLLLPTVYDCVAADGTVLKPPSGVRTGLDDDENVVYLHSRAKEKDKGLERVHEPVGHHKKPHGATTGLFTVAATTRGRDSYTRVVLSLDMSHGSEGEGACAYRALDRLYSYTGHQRAALLYDGLADGLFQHHFLASFGVHTVNAVHTRKAHANRDNNRPDPATGDTATTLSGARTRSHGVNKGTTKLTYTSPLAAAQHPDRAGKPCLHYLVADGGALYEATKPATEAFLNVARSTTPLQVDSVERRQNDAYGYFLTIELSGPCTRPDAGGRFTVRHHLRRRVTSTGPVRRTSLLANLRVLPEAFDAEFAAVYNRRNDVESYWSRVEQTFFHKDRAASWGRDAQLLDQLGIALYENSKAFAHLAHRHPAHAAQLDATLAALPLHLTPSHQPLPRHAEQEALPGLEQTG